MRKLKKLWIVRNPGTCDGAWYGLFVGKKPRSGNHSWPGPDVWLCPRLFHATHSIRLNPGDGPVEVEPMRVKGGK